MRPEPRPADRISNRFSAQAGTVEEGQRAALYLARTAQARRPRSRVETEQLPPLAELEPDRPYMGWTGTLRTAAPASRSTKSSSLSSAIASWRSRAIDGRPASPPMIRGVADVPARAGRSAAADAAARASRGRAGDAAARRAPTRRRRPPAPGASPPPRPGGRRATTTRVELEKIDRVVNMVGELVIAQAMLGQIVHALPEEVSSRLVADA